MMNMNSNIINNDNFKERVQSQACLPTEVCLCLPASPRACSCQRLPMRRRTFDFRCARILRGYC